MYSDMAGEWDAGRGVIASLFHRVSHLSCLVAIDSSVHIYSSRLLFFHCLLRDVRPQQPSRSTLQTVRAPQTTIHPSRPAPPTSTSRRRCARRQCFRTYTRIHFSPFSTAPRPVPHTRRETTPATTERCAAAACRRAAPTCVVVIGDRASTKFCSSPRLSETWRSPGPNLCRPPAPLPLHPPHFFRPSYGSHSPSGALPEKDSGQSSGLA